MKTFWKIFCVALFGISVYGLAADYTATVGTPNGINYNKLYREVGDGTHAETFDNVSVSTYTTIGATATVKATGGYIEGFNLNRYVQAGCSMQFPVTLYDNTSATGNIIVRISSTTIGAATAAGSTYFPVKAKFSALTIGIDNACNTDPEISAYFR